MTPPMFIFQAFWLSCVEIAVAIWRMSWRWYLTALVIALACVVVSVAVR